MATSTKFSPSFDSALCFIPPDALLPSIDSVRSLYDRVYEKWPPHVNIAYPFVGLEVLDEAANILCELDLASLVPKEISLCEADFFKHRSYNSIVLCPQRQSDSAFASQLVGEIRHSLGWSRHTDDSQLHMTVGQSDDHESDSHEFLLGKARLLTPLRWTTGHLAILVRSDKYSMRLWARIDIHSRQLNRFSPPLNLCAHAFVQHRRTFEFRSSVKIWCPLTDNSSSLADNQTDQLIVASYNVLAEFKWPPSSGRYSALISHILSERAVSDILVLQEVTDHFLTYLLQDPDICKLYRFSTHGSPGVHGNGPLPSHLNIVVLSKIPFTWQYVPFNRKHKGATVLQFHVSHTTSHPSVKPLPIILAACHLTQGLVDGAVVAKKNELLAVVGHLSKQFHGHPWIIAGDFNIATSSLTIDLARKKEQLSFQGYQYFCDLDQILADRGFQDAWLQTRLRSGVSYDSADSSRSLQHLYEGEQGATFDPLTNDLAAKTVGNDLNNRPQRYDRILFNDASSLSICGFNTFGQPKTPAQKASDHWGIRCLFKRMKQDSSQTTHASKTVPVVLKQAPPSLGSTEDLKATLRSLNCLPTAKEEEDRIEALQLLKRVLCHAERDQIATSQRQGLEIVIIPVGSYGLGVWTTESDIDCLCVGNISTKVFFALALSKLRSARHDGITALRVVRARTGTMLELSVLGIKFDLQYCTASLVAERYPDILDHPATDAAFKLPIQILSKLKPARDLAYLRRSIPDLAIYRLSHLFIKAWAKSRGIYSAKFGLLGGINVSVMLVPICKLLALGGGNVSTADIINTFFHYYADLDWKEHVAFDPFFHGDVKYHRTLREPMCLLGWHTPALNTALNARDILLHGTVTWDGFLKRDASVSLGELTSRSASHFLNSYKSYVKIDARYWGYSSNPCRRFIGWLESRCVMVLVDINRRVPTLMTRIWPARLIPRVSDTTDADNYWSYLFGLEWQSSDVSREQIKVAEQTLHNVLQDFENRIRSDAKYFDQNSCWLLASVVSAASVRDLQIDSQPVSQENAGDTDSEEGLELDDEVPSSEHQSVTSPRISDVARKPVGGPGKLRAASDVMSRLRWDPAIDSSDYLVGYEDRFVGAQEKALEAWKGEQTDEEFIPQHRILYFKRKSDGAVVWDRRRRIDNVFGSGRSGNQGT